MKSFIPVTIKEIDKVWHNANFGIALNVRRMDVIKGALLKWASGFTTGHTAFRLLVDLELMTEKKRITFRGKRQLWEFFSQNCPSV